MTGRLMLVIGVVAAAVVAATTAFLRSRHMLRRPAASTSGDLRGTRPLEPDHAGLDLQLHTPAASGLTDPARPGPGVLQAESDSAKPSVGTSHTELESTLDLPPDTPGTAITALLSVTAVTQATAAIQPANELLSPASVLSKLHELALGRPRPPSELNPGHAEIAANVSRLIDDAATRDRYVPRRPNMLPRVLSASSDDSFSRRELAALIARDPSLVGNLLKIANSSYYRVTPQPVESVDRAVVLLGTDGIRSLVTAALMQPIFRIGGADFPRFPEIAWEQTFRSASATVAHNFLLEQSDPFAAELLSLVMGLAEIVIFRMTMDQYAQNPRLRADAGVVSSLLDKHGASLAHRIGTSWDLSEPTLAGLDGQTINNTRYSSAFGRSVRFGRVVGALAVLRINHAIDDKTAKASIPATHMPEQQLERMWSRLTYKEDEH